MKKSTFKVDFLLITIVMMLSFTGKVNGQLVHVSLKEDGVYREQLSLKRQLDTTVVKNVPAKLFAKWSLRRVAYNPSQNLFDDVLDGKRSTGWFSKFVRNNNIDTVFLSKQKIPKNLIYVVTGLDDSGLKYVIVDANNNRDFADDKVYSFNLKDTKKVYPELQVAISYFDGIVIKDAWVTMVIDAYDTAVPDSYFSVVKDKALDITLLKTFPDWSGEVTIEKEKYLIKISNYNKLYKNSSFKISVEKIVPGSLSKHLYSYLSTDTIDIGYNRYLYSGMAKLVLSLNYVKKNDLSGGEINSLAPPIEGKDVMTGLSFSLKKYLGKYVLIDFWGTWCGPCIKAIPELKNIYHQYQQNVAFVSVAFDKTADMDKLRTLITKYGMTWHHLFDNMEAGKSIIAKQFKVQQFPTSILIDPKGKVVFRSVSEVGLKDLANYLVKVGVERNKN